MNVELIKNAEKSNSYMEKTKHSNPSYDNARIADSMMGYSLDITGKVMENAAYGKGDLLSAEEMAAKASLVDAKTQRNYMAVMSNSMSEDEFSELLKDGYNPTHTKIEEQVTNLDKIKAKMAESGNVITGFNDNLSQEELTAALGMAGEIKPVNDEAKAYMIKNDMEPTISNLYMAEHSAMDIANSYGNTLDKGTVYQGGAAFATKGVSQSEWDSIKSQAEEIVERIAAVDKEQGMEAAKWLAFHQLPIDEENIISYREISSLTFPVRDEDVYSAIRVAIEDGKSPKEANLADKESVYDKAVRMITEFATADDGGDLIRKRQLEEIRLAMTVEANLTLLRKGISLDTKNLEGIVDKLREAEKEFYRPLLTQNNEFSADGKIGFGEEKLSERIDLYKETVSAVEYLKISAPAEAIVDAAFAKADITIGGLRQNAASIEASYTKAGREYEKLMTAPRTDMGDSIAKAFGNVDDILEDLGLDLSDTNRKAVRVLGYSQMQITRESVAEVREAQRVVTSVIDMMTPARTLKLIREGHNPLNENIYELDKKLKEESIDDTSEKYSEFLQKLERRGEISQDEKSSFIGMYRLFEKIERQDSRVIGKVLDSGQDLTFANLLSAYRSKKLSGLDISVDEEFGLLENVISKGETITEQIEKAFRQIKEEEAPKEYIKEKFALIKEANDFSEGEGLLKELKMPVTIENILAANDFGGRRKKAFSYLNPDEKRENDESRTAVREKLSSVIDRFDDKNSAENGYEEAITASLDIAEDAITEATSAQDVKDWLRLHKQITVAGNLAKRDEYEIPVETDDGFISIRVKLVKSTEAEGRVDANFESATYGQVRASFFVNGDNVRVIVSSSKSDGLRALKDKEADLRQAIEKENISVNEISYVQSSMPKEQPLAKGDATNTTLFKVAKAFLTTMSKERDYED